MDIATTFFPSKNPRLFSYKINPSYYHKRRLINNGFIIIKAKQGDDQDSDYERKSIVDENNMIVLKMRIKKMKILESNNKNNNEGAAAPSSDWNEWEKKLFTHYHEGVCDSMELLQSYLMNTRPSLALGALVLLAMSFPFSSSVVMVNALKVARGLLAGCHVCIDIDF
ncbi:hypothetical protein ACP275_08G068900 [Erythranthe tilingii]